MRRFHAFAGPQSGKTLACAGLIALSFWLTGCVGLSKGNSSPNNPGGAISVTVSPGTASLSSAGQLQFTATVSNTSNVGVTWSALAGTVDSGGLYTAPQVNTTTNTMVTATSSADPTKSTTAYLTITPAGQVNALSITTTSLPSVTSGAAYSGSLNATGGTAPYTWAVVSGSLPAGITLQSNGTISGTTTQVGSFSFTVQVDDSSSTPEYASQNLTLSVNSSVSGPTFSTYFFGADFNVAKNWPPTDGLGQAATLSGIRLWDDNVKWGQIETSDGAYDWTTLDTYLGNAQSLNMDVLYTFGDTPQFAAITTPPGTCLQAGPYSCAPPIDVNADGTGTDAYFQAFVTALVTHAAGRIAYYELWNEPDCNCFWAGTTAQLVRMSQDAATIIRSLDPNAKILSPSAHGPTMATWFDGYVAVGGANYFDIVNVHMRGQNGTNYSPEAFLTVWGQVQAEVQARNLTAMPIWDDEHGILDTDGVTDPDELAGYVARSLILRAGVGGIQRQYVYMWDSVAPYGLQGNLSGTAWDQVASWLIGHSISPCAANGTVYACQLDNGLIVWDTAQSCSSGVCTTSNFTYPTGYAWYRVMSNSTKAALSGGIVQIGYKPILLTN
ncbi:MAG TPA: Ig domain-containing protein [Candidatus Sulfotelmatobacter sp.]|nr:Ig domain-containing protein [Candidatus Sulfotelmatobacter sp.]